LLAFFTVEVGLTEQQFWRLTPAKLTAIVSAKKEQIKREDYRTGVLTMVVRGALGAKNLDPFDFFPQHKDRSVSNRRGITTASEVRNNFRAYIEATNNYGEKKAGS
jgi:hypothetical protein